MIDFMKRSQELEDYHVSNRRNLHKYPELGTALPQTTTYVKERLAELGCAFTEIAQGGIVGEVGNNTGKTILLRADMDALPIQEESGLTFSSHHPGVSHCCGHDIHVSFLLGAAKLLKEREADLPGLVKLIFQAGEESLEGANNMIEAGVLKMPRVDRAIGIHVQPMLPLGHLHYAKGVFLSSTDAFEIRIKGKGCHGGLPHLGIDPINIAAHILLSLQSLQVKEVPASACAVLNVCQIKSGSSSNVAPDTAVLQGTLRTYDNRLREILKSRIIQIAELSASMFQASADTIFTMSCPCTVNDPEFTASISNYINCLEMKFQTDGSYKMQVSDDFAFFSQQIPSTMFIIGCEPETGNTGCNHCPTVSYNENVLPIGAALLAHSAYCWLKDDKLPM